MKLALYHVNIFTNKVFHGSQAVVVPLQEWIDDTQMQQIALENNLAETVFFGPPSKPGADYDIRLFTTTGEVTFLKYNVCCQSWLAAAYVAEILGHRKEAFIFNTKNIIRDFLKVKKEGKLFFIAGFDVIEEGMPTRFINEPYVYYRELTESLKGFKIINVYYYHHIIVELENEEAVKNCNADFTTVPLVKIILTAPGKEVDFVYRYFFLPDEGYTAGQDFYEDTVTGSAHYQLYSLWSQRLNKTKISSRQLSIRDGEIWCQREKKGINGNYSDISIGGECILYMKAETGL
jgi:predicted PhzF superfamily epimerase YddE/YHI9